MSKNIWIYVTGVLVMLTTVALGLLIPHKEIGLYFIALGLLVLSEFLFFLQLIVKRHFTDWLPINIVTVIWVIFQSIMLFISNYISIRVFWIVEVIVIGGVAIIGSLTATDSHYRRVRREIIADNSEDVFTPKQGDY
ncbi:MULTISPECIES: hypothetical protein [Streptococcus]|uniref:hypothetical protein n=1 Tax=Streptococcus TaxID=1301 RepID=UPI0003F59C0F|nr:hypothetical protein [Streptococcus suis]MCL4922473.1 hypothetical protein [Streptococcus suis]HEM6576869.1 hypothetical protein [Streptococcus suis]